MQENKNLIISGILFTIVIFLWPLLMVLFRLPEGMEDHFRWILDHSLEYKSQFFFAFLIGPSTLYLMYSQLDKFPARRMIWLITGTIFLSGYFILCSISYASQMIILPKFLELELTSQARLWYFNAPDSIPYFLNQMGYCFWGAGSLILFTKLIRENGIIKYISILYTIAALLSIAAFAGLIVDNKDINALTLYSGMVLIPVGIMSITWGFSGSQKR